MSMLEALKSSCCLELYVSGDSTAAPRAIENLGRLCRDLLPGGNRVRVIDVLQSPDAADAQRITWTPTLVKTFPSPARRVVGDLSNAESVLQALDLPPDLTGPQTPSPTPTLEAGSARDPFERLLLSSPDGVVLLEPEGSVIFANPAAERLLGCSSDEILGRFLGVPWLDRETPVRIPVGEGRTVEARSALVDWEGGVKQMLCVRDVTASVVAEDRASALVASLLATTHQLGRDATSDPLTGVLNRRGLGDALTIELSRTRRMGGSISALLIDCDDFKRINDTLGHTVGDAALRAIVETLCATLRPQDGVGRIGGDEFLILLPGTEPSAAVQVGERILRELAVRPMPDSLRGHRLTVSIGAALVPPEAATLEQVMAAASAPLKMAKTHGKHRVVLAEFRDGMLLPERSEADTGELGVEPRQLRVVSQSIVDISSRSVRGRELLVRGPEGEFERPRALFEAARNLGLIETLDAHCLQATLGASQALPGVRHHINVLPATLSNHAALLEQVEQRSPETPLCFEVNEQEIVGDPSPLKPARDALREHGVAFALDNVGFGRSALEALVVLQPDIIKIGVRLVREVSRRAGQSRDLRRLLTVAQTLGVEVIAQGVESEEDAQALLELGIRNAQGYLWEKPA